MFETLEFKRLPSLYSEGIQARIYFENGFGASVVQSDFSYGGKDGLYELAVLDEKGQITYETPITNDVIGFLNEEEVDAICKDVAALPEAQEEPQEAPTAEDCWDGDASHSE